jgi:hypothetical protein
MRGSTTGAPRSRRLAIIAANPCGTVYGTIVATAVIAATAGHQTPGLVLAATVATLLVFWLAHVYSDFLDHGVRGARFDLKILPGIMARELSMLAAPALSRCCCPDARATKPLGYQWPRWTTESSGRRSGRAIGARGRSAG